jgi:hypothetical protein
MRLGKVLIGNSVQSYIILNKEVTAIVLTNSLYL